MKISKSLLQSIAVGVSLGTLATSCSSNVLTPILDDPDKSEITPQVESEDDGTCDPWGDCPACGLG